MHATVLALLLVTAGQQPSIDEYQQPMVVTAGCGCGTHDRCACRACRCRRGPAWACLSAWLGPLPQTCYAPRLGCCPANSQCTHRYPVYYGDYQSQVYDYRRLFDYPWHARRNGPQGRFTCQHRMLLGEEQIPVPYPESEGEPSEPRPLVPGAP